MRTVGSVNLRALAARVQRTAVPTSRQGSLPAATGSGARRIVDAQAAAFHPGGVQGSAKISPEPTPVTSAQVSGERGFAGISGPQQAQANGGLDLEPPDQGLCAGNGSVGEFINSAWTVYSTTGTQQEAVIPSYAIFDQPSNSFFSDPRCYYDAPTGRWFLISFTIRFSPSGALVPPAVQYVAVSDTSDPLGEYTILSFSTTDRTEPNCPCYGDFDQLGADDNGIYISTNEFGDQGGFNGVVIYAMSKQLLETEATTGIPPTLFAYHVPKDPFGQPYHVAPAQTPPGAMFAQDTEYFVESNSDAFGDHHLVVYAMTNTSLLAQPAPPPLIRTPKIASEPYEFPPDALQKKGPIPLGKASQDPEGQLQADFNAIQQVTYTNGTLYAEAATGISGNRVGTAWFAIAPSLSGTTLSATVTDEGYVAVAGQSLIYPVIAVNASGQGFIAFTLSGKNYYPSAAYVQFGPSGPTGPIHVAAMGAGPEDSFTCYAAFVGPNYGGCRWGDYSMGVAMGSRVYLATETVPNSARDYLTNWGTFVWSAPTTG
jgi:hypothetical protein